jgi:hypothetical protein
MAKCRHRFVAYPLTGINVWTGKETLFGFSVKCEKCHKPAPDGVEVMAVNPSWYREVIPEEITLNG